MNQESNEKDLMPENVAPKLIENRLVEARCLCDPLSRLLRNSIT